MSTNRKTYGVTVTRVVLVVNSLAVDADSAEEAQQIARERFELLPELSTTLHEHVDASEVSDRELWEQLAEEDHRFALDQESYYDDFC